MHPVDRVVALAFFGPPDELAPQPRTGRLGRVLDRVRDVVVGDDAFDQPPLLHAVEQAARAIDVVVLQIDQRDPRVGECEAVTLAVGLDQLVLDDPVAFAVERQRVFFDLRERVLPHGERLLFEHREFVMVGVAHGPIEVLALDLERAGFATVGEANATSTREIVADLTNRTNGVFEGHVAQHDLGIFEHAQQQRARADLEEGRVLTHVGVTHDDVEPAIALGVGVRLVARVDDGARACGCGRDTFPDVLGPLRDAVHRPTRRL